MGLKLGSWCVPFPSEDIALNKNVDSSLVTSFYFISRDLDQKIQFCFKFFKFWHLLKTTEEMKKEEKSLVSVLSK